MDIIEKTSRDFGCDIQFLFVCACLYEGKKNPLSCARKECAVYEAHKTPSLSMISFCCGIQRSSIKLPLCHSEDCAIRFYSRRRRFVRSWRRVCNMSDQEKAVRLSRRLHILIPECTQEV